jgi:hypothetical protein
MAAVLLTGLALGAVTTTSASASTSTVSQYCWVNKDHVPFYDAPAPRGGRFLGVVDFSGRYFELTNLDPEWGWDGGRLDGRGDVVWFDSADIDCNVQ